MNLQTRWIRPIRIRGIVLLIDAPISGAPRILILTTFDLDDYVYEALRAGASGFLVKDARAEELRQAVRMVASGDALLSPAITRRLIESYTRRPPSTVHPAPLAELTPRELEVLRLVARGLSNADIARELIVGDATVKTHVARPPARGRARRERSGDARGGRRGRCRRTRDRDRDAGARAVAAACRRGPAARVLREAGRARPRNDPRRARRGGACRHPRPDRLSASLRRGLSRRARRGRLGCARQPARRSGRHPRHA